MYSKETDKSIRREVRYYHSFRLVKVGDKTIRVAPVRKNIPALRFAGIDESTKDFIIEYELRDEGSTETYSHDRVRIYQGRRSERIGRIVVKDWGSIDTDAANLEAIRTTFNRFRTDYHDSVDDSEDLSFRLKRAGRYDMIDRQISESSDLVSTSVLSGNE